MKAIETFSEPFEPFDALPVLELLVPFELFAAFPVLELVAPLDFGEALPPVGGGPSEARCATIGTSSWTQTRYSDGLELWSICDFLFNPHQKTDH